MREGTGNAPCVDALLLAAGAGSRMKEATGGKNKVLLELGGVPLFVHPLRKLAASPHLRRIVMVHRAEEEEVVRRTVDGEHLGREIRFVPGGPERFDSVYHGLAALESDPPDYVLIQDSARPFLRDRFIEESVRQAVVYRACTVAVPLSDTLKRMEGEALVETLPRENLYRIQTPQTFDFSLLWEAHNRFRDNPLPGITDDCMLLERKGLSIGLVMGEESNIKVTTAFDLNLAESIFQETFETSAK